MSFWILQINHARGKLIRSGTSLLTDKEKLKDIISAIARKLRFRPVVVEKDYYLTIILNNIEELLSNKIVFKGGTLLNKAHLNYHRLSEDLDFTYDTPLPARA